MFGVTDYAAFVVAFIILLAIPGPGNLALILSTGKGGIRGGLASTFGIIFGDQVLLWLAVIVGVYVIFPLYRATPPEGATDLAMYPRAMVLANPDTAWLHSFAMEIKEHVPFIAGMLATAVAFVGLRSPAQLVREPSVRGIGMTLLVVCLILVGAAGLLGVFINKVAPLQ